MRYIKLREAGESQTLTVTACAPATTGSYPGLVFEDRGQDVAVEVPTSSAERQLTRLKLTAASVVGKTITISRDPNATNPTKPFWGISLEGDAAAQDEDDVWQRETGAPPAQNAPPRAHPPHVAPNGASKGTLIEQSYLALYDRVFAHLKKTAGGNVDVLASAQAATATVWLTWKDKGLIA